jgi:hypothetical protein
MVEVGGVQVHSPENCLISRSLKKIDREQLRSTPGDMQRGNSCEDEEDT